MLSNSQKLLFIRFAYWLGAILDAFWGFLSLIYMFFSEQRIFVDLGYPSPISDFDYYTLVGVSSLMLGWTCLLFWADRKPIERRDTLLITVGVMFIMFTLQLNGLLSRNPYISLISLISNGTIIIYGLAYYFARHLAIEVRELDT
ncbi:MAG: hypothetical protein JSW11_11600 [Candidatus Heimdallarchaeota archaeon]|nr:MAG: hypothetical protein JSW11_11600 [Candidatus Heimdallarchaeota archaeon]